MRSGVLTGCRNPGNGSMDWLQAVILALIQGVTEFLPVSSQAHLVIYAWISGEQYQGLDFDIILHAGSLLAVVWYFRRDLISMAGAWLGSFAGRGSRRDARLAWWVIIATLPAAVLGFMFKDAAEEGLRAIRSEERRVGKGWRHRR